MKIIKLEELRTENLSLRDLIVNHEIEQTNYRITIQKYKSFYEYKKE